jgi:hypothetical protein
LRLGDGPAWDAPRKHGQSCVQQCGEDVQSGMRTTRKNMPWPQVFALWIPARLSESRRRGSTAKQIRVNGRTIITCRASPSRLRSAVELGAVALHNYKASWAVGNVWHRPQSTAPSSHNALPLMFWPASRDWASRLGHLHVTHQPLVAESSHPKIMPPRDGRIVQRDQSRADCRVDAPVPSVPA